MKHTCTGHAAWDPQTQTTVGLCRHWYPAGFTNTHHPLREKAVARDRVSSTTLVHTKPVHKASDGGGQQVEKALQSGTRTGCPPASGKRGRLTEHPAGSPRANANVLLKGHVQDLPARESEG